MPFSFMLSSTVASAQEGQGSCHERILERCIFKDRARCELEFDRFTFHDKTIITINCEVSKFDKRLKVEP